jgi:hypothetical protein
MKVVRAMKFKIFISLFILVLAAACTKKVTNNAFNSKNSTVTTETQNPVKDDQDNNTGGVINGGGGKGVLCEKDGKKTLEVLDLYEAKNIYQLKINDFGNDEERAKDNLALLLAHHFGGVTYVSDDKYAKVIRKIYIDELTKNTTMLKEGKTLNLTNDAYEPIKEEGCKPVQIGMYYDESTLIIDPILWAMLDVTNKTAFIAHEVMYFIARRSGTTNSMSTRKLVGLLMSTKGARPLADGAPQDKEELLECRIQDDKGFDSGKMFLFPGKNAENKRTLETIFVNLGSDSMLFRLSASFDDLTFDQLTYPKFSGEREAALEKDTYPVRDKVHFKFHGISDQRLNFDISILRGGAEASPDTTFHSFCHYMPSDTSRIEGIVATPEKLEKMNGSWPEILTINANGSMTFDATYSGCHTKDIGSIMKNTADEIEYLVVARELVEDPKNDASCSEQLKIFNQANDLHFVHYTHYKKEFVAVGQDPR